MSDPRFTPEYIAAEIADHNRWAKERDEEAARAMAQNPLPPRRWIDRYGLSFGEDAGL